MCEHLKIIKLNY